jgi:hypothetical protein
VLFVAGRKKESESMPPREAPHFGNLPLSGTELISISALKFLPPIWTVIEPFPQGGTRGEIFYPLVNVYLVLCETARP